MAEVLGISAVGAVEGTALAEAQSRLLGDHVEATCRIGEELSTPVREVCKHQIYISIMDQMQEGVDL